MEVTNRGDVSILRFAGHLSLNLGEYKIKDLITDLLNGGARKILLQLKDVEYINSAGIGELVGAYIAVTNRGGKIKLCGLPDKVNKMMKVTQLISIFDVYKTEEEALNKFE